MASPKGKRQIAKSTKRQLGYEFGRNVLNQISQLANGVRDLVHRGRAIDARTGMVTQVTCAPADIKRSFSPEQAAAVEEFIADWSTEEEAPPPAPAPAPPPAPGRTPRKKKR